MQGLMRIKQQASTFNPEKLKKQYQALQKHLDEVNETQQRIANASALAQGAVHSLFDALTTDFNNFGDNARNVLRNILNEITRQVAVDPLAEWAGAGISALIAGAGGGAAPNMPLLEGGGTGAILSGAAKSTSIQVDVHQNFTGRQDERTMRRAGKVMADETAGKIRAQVAVDTRQQSLLGTN